MHNAQSSRAIGTIWDLVFDYLGCPPTLSNALWGVVEQRHAHDIYARQLFYSMQGVVGLRQTPASGISFRKALFGMCGVYFQNVFHAKNVLPWLERLAAEGALPHEDFLLLRRLIRARLDDDEEWHDFRPHTRQ